MVRRDFRKVPKSPSGLKVKTWKQVYQKLRIMEEFGEYSEIVAIYLYNTWGEYLGVSKQEMMTELARIQIDPKKYSASFDKTQSKKYDIFNAVVPRDVWDEEKISDQILWHIGKVLTYLRILEFGLPKRPTPVDKKTYEEVRAVLKK